jgi:endoglucanase
MPQKHCTDKANIWYTEPTALPEMPKIKIVFLLVLLLFGACSPSFPRNPPASLPVPSSTRMSTSPPATSDIFALNQHLRRTVNLGNALEAPNEGEWGVTLQEEYFQVIADAGFTSVRIPINFSAHALIAPPFTMDTTFLKRVDWAVQNATSRSLVAILDMHNYQVMMDTPSTELARFMALWKQIAEHYKSSRNDQVYFELLNEPFNKLDDSTWNSIVEQTLAVVRQTNPARPIIIGPSSWNAFDHVSNLQLPDDPNLIVTFHYYGPFQFTHQGAEWVDGSNAWLGTPWDSTPGQVAAISRDFDSVAVWAAQHNRPVFVGEFGAYSKADQAARIRWTAAVARTAEEHGFSWGYWEFCAGFGVYDPVVRQWRTDLLHALLSAPMKD